MRKLQFMGAALTLSLSFPALATDLTYENWAEGFFSQTCTSCHHSSLSGKDRFGAPRGVNFDTLELIRGQAEEIREAAAGDDHYMPPAGVTWWWDRASLTEWLDAGMPGGGEALAPIEVDKSRKTLAYQSASFYLYKPSESGDNDRVLRIRRWSDKDTEVPQEYRVSITKREDGTVVMTRREWADDDGGTRRLDYSPGVPILPNGGQVGAADWYSTVEVRERQWTGPTYRTPDYETVQTEQWLVKTEGIEDLDNGVILPVQALKVVQSNLTTDTHTTWWYTKGLGLVRRQEDAPSFDFDRDITLEYNILEREDDPLRDPPYITAAMEEWLPIVGPQQSAERNDYDYGYQFDYRQVAVVDSLADPSPTPTAPPLGPDPTVPPVQPTPTFTPVGFGSNPNTGPGGMSPADPRISDLQADNFVDDQDLLIFIQHWHQNIP